MSYFEELNSSSDGMMLREMIESELERILDSVNRKILPIPNKTVSKYHLLGSFEIVLKKSKDFKEMQERGIMSSDLIVKAFRGEFMRSALILIYINKDVQDEDDLNLDSPILEKLEKYLGNNFMDLCISVTGYNIDGDEK